MTSEYVLIQGFKFIERQGDAVCLGDMPDGDLWVPVNKTDIVRNTVRIERKWLEEYQRCLKK